MEQETWVVLKFGGTSVSTAARWRRIADQIRAKLAAPEAPRVWVAISALSQVTNKLTRAVAAAAAQHESHLQLARDIVEQHFTLAYDVGLLPAVDGVGSVEQLDRWRRKWLDAVFDDGLASGNGGNGDEAIPVTLLPLLQELKVGGQQQWWLLIDGW